MVVTWTAPSALWLLLVVPLVWVAVLVLSTLAVVMYATVSWLEGVLRKGTRQ